MLPVDAKDQKIAALEKEHADAPDEAARRRLVWQDVAHAFFCLKEFIYVE